MQFICTDCSEDLSPSRTGFVWICGSPFCRSCAGSYSGKRRVLKKMIREGLAERRFGFYRKPGIPPEELVRRRKKFFRTAL